MMSLSIRCALASAILLLGLMPAWSRTERVILRGNTFVFEVPDNLSLEFNRGGYDPVAKRPNDDLQTYSDDSSHDSTFLLFGYEPDRFDFRHYVDAPGAIERSNSVSIVRSTKIIEMAASTSACGGKCFIVVKLTPDPTLYDSSRAEALFQRFVRALDTRSFESPGPGDLRSTGPQGHWLVVAGSWPLGQTEKVTARLSLLSRSGISAKRVSTDDYPGLTPGLAAVVLGPFEKDQAQAQLEAVQPLVPDAFIKQSP